MPNGHHDDRSRIETISALSQHVTRPLVTLLLVMTFCYGFVRGMVSVEAFVPIVASAVGFWYAQRTEPSRATDSAKQVSGATAVAPPGGGTATATVVDRKSVV